MISIQRTLPGFSVAREKKMELKKIALAVALIGAGAQVAYAEEVVKIEKIEVTGSSIKRVSKETASPITTITKQNIEASGFTTMSQVLSNIPGNNSGGFNEANVNSFAAGAAAVSLRGLGPQATLILLNGRRMTNYGFAVGGQSTFVDLNTIPLEAVERIEILKDGASAIYGSDAMAGVINIILTKSYVGYKGTASYGQSDKGDDQQLRATATVGFGDLSTDKWNVFANFEYFKRDPVFQRDRQYPFNSTDRRGIGMADARSTASYPGNLYNAANTAFISALPGCDPSNLNGGAAQYGGGNLTGRCLLNANNYIVASPKSDRVNVYSRANVQLSDSINFFLEAGQNDTKTQTVSTPTQLTSWLRATDLTLQTVSPTILPVGHPNNPTNKPVSIRYAFGDVGPRIGDLDSKLTRIVTGLNGSLGDWDWDAALGYLKSETENVRKGYISASVFREVVANQTYFFGDRSKNSADLYARLSPNLVRTGDTSTKFFDVKVSNSNIVELPGGPLGVALGAGVRKEDLHDRSDDRIASGDIIGLGATSADGDRKAYNVFGELNVPVLRNLEAQLALRTDHYSDFGSSTTPKIGFKWTPTKAFALRGTYAEGFRAPSLPEISKSVLTGFYNGIEDPARCPTTGTSADCNASIPALIGANSHLKPEESRSATFGFVFEPNSSFNTAVDFYRINRRHEVGALDPDVLLANESLYPGQVVRAPRDVVNNIPGAVQYLVLNYQNLGETRTTGVDVDLTLKKNLGELGKLTTNVNTSYTISYLVRPTEGSDLLEYNGTHNQPRLRANIGTNWEKGAWATGARVNYIGNFDYRSSPITSCPASVANYRPTGCSISSYTTVDANLSYSGFKGWKLTANVQNLFNRMPAIDTTYTQNYDYNYHDIIGRYFSVGASYQFK
jgi:iron complex outermembrane receptor protein